ncbi:hypothetical protein E2C01_082219 [Portunus trituberculatus]|uniref:Uncharacterized protein n=1 Tax=Portunus trituberculatus TaxID=210409 RepID=A0A5B7J369_PORTR|nr:hypothetical protein [Portunus trituberculatus]
METSLDEHMITVFWRHSPAFTNELLACSHHLVPFTWRSSPGCSLICLPLPHLDSTRPGPFPPGALPPGALLHEKQMRNYHNPKLLNSPRDSFALSLILLSW